MSETQKERMWRVESDDEGHVFSTVNEAVEAHLDFASLVDLRDAGTELTVKAYSRDTLTKEYLQECLSSMHEDLYENFVWEDCSPYDGKGEALVEKAEEAYIQAIVDNFDVTLWHQVPGVLEDETVNIREWCEKHRPDWILHLSEGDEKE